MTRIMEAFAARKDAVKKGDKGFTLIELLVVVIIIGILAAIAIPVYVGIQDNAKDSAVKTDLGNIKTAVVAYYTKEGKYPTQANVASKTDLKDYGWSGGSVASYGATGSNAKAPALKAAITTGSFCIDATSETGKVFSVTDSSGAKDGAC